MLDTALISAEGARPLRRAEYDRMVELGFFDDQRVELLGGVLFEMSPHGVRHAAVIRRLFRVLLLAVGDRALVQSQLPFAVGEDSEPEPDLAVVPNEDYRRSHPTRAHLVVEVSETSQRKDRDLKARLYALAGVPEYWLVDVKAGRIEVRTRPRGGKYRAVRVVRAGSIRLVAFPELEIAVADVLG